MAKKSIKTEQLEETVGMLHKELLEKDEKISLLSGAYDKLENTCADLEHQLSYAKVDCESALIACNQCEADLDVAVNEATRLNIANEKNELIIKEYEGNVIQLVEDRESLNQRCLNYESQLISDDDEIRALKEKIDFLLVDGLNHKSLIDHLMIWHLNTRTIIKVLSLMVMIFLLFSGAYFLYVTSPAWSAVVLSLMSWLSFVTNFLYYEN